MHLKAFRVGFVAKILFYFIHSQSVCVWSASTHQQMGSKMKVWIISSEANLIGLSISGRNQMKKTLLKLVKFPSLRPDAQCKKFAQNLRFIAIRNGGCQFSFPLNWLLCRTENSKLIRMAWHSSIFIDYYWYICFELDDMADEIRATF